MHIKHDKNIQGSVDPIYTISIYDDELFAANGIGEVLKWPLSDMLTGIRYAKADVSLYALTQNEKYLFLGDRNGFLYILDKKSKDLLWNKKIHQSSIFDIILANNNLVSIGGDGNLVTIDLSDFSTIKIFNISIKSLRSVIYIKQNEQYIISSSDNIIYIVDAKNGDVLQKLSGHELSVFALSKISDTVIVSGSRDAHLIFWDIASCSIIHKIPAHLSTINKIVPSPSGEVFATASRDKTVKIWDAKSFELLKVIDKKYEQAHTHSVNTLCWNGNYSLCTAGDDKVIKVWDINYQ